MEAAKITRAALGSTASLGDLYDARRDDFSGISIFKNTIPPSAITLLDANFQDTRLVHSDIFSEKATELDVSAELQVSVLAGLCTLEGSGQYLNDQKQSARTVKSSLVHNIKTKNESLNIYHDDLREYFAVDAIESGLATHVVVGISWGANSILSCVYENKENRDVQEIAGSLSATLQKASLSILGRAEVDITESEKLDREKFEIHVYGDILSNDRLPRTFESALEFMTQVPTLVKNCNNGKGKPLKYHLLPVSLLQRYLNFSIGADMMIRSLQKSSLTRVVKMFEHMSEAQRKLNDFYQDALDHSYCVTREDLDDIGSLKDEMAIEETSFRAQLSETLQKIRSGKIDVDRLESFLKEMQTSNWTPSGIITKLSKWSSITEKIRLAVMLVEQGAKYIGVGSSFDEEISHNYDAMCYILYFTQKAKGKETLRWNGNRQIFVQEMKKPIEGNKFFAVDCDIHPELKIGNHFSCVQTMQWGMVLVEDLWADQQKLLGVPLVQLDHNKTDRLAIRPDVMVPLEIPCVGYHCSPTPTYEWKCNKCLTVVEYAFDDHVHCVCGRVPVVSLEFKCSDPKHGIKYERHKNNILNHLISALHTKFYCGFEENCLKKLFTNLKSHPKLNILIMGETGVGKSTWINGFKNYLTFESLGKAEKSDLVTLIPTKFTVCGEDFREVEVRTGTDKNEIFTLGQSATQEAQVHPFTVGNTEIRLIDTPGIGDTRGIEQDKKNFQNILSTLSQFNEIHGICILLKPNNARLTVMFRFFIKELLTYDASKNIMFCFTNSRGTFYRPGDTLPALRKLLDEICDVEIPLTSSTIYCYDSEAYRFLAAVKNDPPVTFPEDERKSFAKSWEKSISETKRMFKHVMSLQPFSVSTQPSYMSTQPSYMSTQPSYMSTQPSYKSVQPFSTFLGPTVMSIQPLSGISFVMMRHARKLVPRLANALANLNRNIHINQQIIRNMGKKIERSGDNKCLKYLTEREMKIKTTEAKDQEIQEYKEELQKIVQWSVIFAYFLTKNGLPFFDVMEKCLNKLIEKQEKVRHGNSRAALDDLETSRRSYIIEKKRFIGEEIRPLNLQDIAQMVTDLKNLKHSGNELKEALEDMYRDVLAET